MPNVKQTIDGHNKSILRMDDPQKKTQNNGCNCKSPNKCPLPNKCLAKSIAYQATVTTNDNKPDQTYIGLTSNTFKTRFANHKTSFTNVKKKHATELSKHVWQLKDNILTIKSNWKLSTLYIHIINNIYTLPTDVTYAFGKSISSFAIHLWLL